MGQKEQIFADLVACHLEGKCDFELLNAYKGAPLITPAVLQDVGEGQAIFVTTPPNSVCLTWSDETLILSDGTLEPIAARVATFDIGTGLVTLERFAYAGYHFGHRREVRVEPEQPLDVEIEHAGGKYAAMLRDISMGGVGLQIDNGECSPDLHKGDVVQVAIHLPSGVVRLAGQILTVSSAGQVCRLALAFHSSGAGTKPKILHYIFQRRAQIMMEIQGKFAAARQATR